ncbi:MAG: phosphatase PAP2 family protein [Bacteroidales bacterium]|nr:phosphatase PAP2 family protein [Bacteroidales bacterium]
MFEAIKNLDKEIFLYLNSANSSFFDPIMWFLSGKIIWLIAVAVILFFLFKKYGNKIWIFVIALALCFLLTEQVCNLIKHSVQRYRPSHNLEISFLAHNLNDYKGGLYGFPSAHAANSFGLAVLSILLIRRKTFTVFILIWATLVSYSRIYLGVHYPSDILAGILLACILAFGVFYLLKLILKRRKISINFQHTN